MKPKVTKKVLDILKRNQRGVKLDIGCGFAKQEGFVGLDNRKVAGVDIVHDAEKVPYPLPDACCSVLLASHLVEHLKPWLMIDIFNEWWRLLQVGGQLLVSMPYGYSHGFLQDPTHCNACNETTWTYFDPDYYLYQIYRPKPWKIERNVFQAIGNMEVILSKRSEKYVGQFSKGGVGYGS